MDMCMAYVDLELHCAHLRAYLFYLFLIIDMFHSGVRTDDLWGARV